MLLLGLVPVLDGLSVHRHGVDKIGTDLADLVATALTL